MPLGGAETSLNGGTRLYSHLAVPNNPKQDWIRVFEEGSYASDAEGVRPPCRSGAEDPILPVLEFGGSRQLGDVASVVVRRSSDLHGSRREHVLSQSAFAQPVASVRLLASLKPLASQRLLACH